MSVVMRQRVERIIVRKIIAVAFANGYRLGVHDGEELVLKDSDNRKDILGAMFSVDEEHMLFYKDGVKCGWVYMIYGNSGWDVVSDHSTNLEEVLLPVFALADKYS